jgi:hypothetical protein
MKPSAGTATTPKPTGKRWVDTLDLELVTAPPGTDGNALLLSLNPPEKIFDTNDGDPMYDCMTPVLTPDSPRDAVWKAPKGSKIHKISKEFEGSELAQNTSNIDSTPASTAIELLNKGGCSIEIAEVIPTLSPKTTPEPKDHVKYGPALATATSPATPHHRTKDIAEKDFEIEEIDSEDDFQVGIARIIRSILTPFTLDGYSEEGQKLQEATAHFKPHFLGELP